MPGIVGQIERELLDVVRKYVDAGETLEPTALLGKDLKIFGGDAIEFMEEVESKYAVDLRPLVNENTRQRPQNLWHKLFGIPNASVDLSIRQIAEYIAQQAEAAGRLPSSE